VCDLVLGPRHPGGAAVWHHFRFPDPGNYADPVDHICPEGKSSGIKGQCEITSGSLMLGTTLTQLIILDKNTLWNNFRIPDLKLAPC
jgi:hypothetical protein